MAKQPGCRVLLACLAALALGGCKSDAVGPLLPVLDAASGSDVETPQAPGGTSAPPAGPMPDIMVTAGVLSSFFVQSFEAFETAAARLRTEDPRYTVQDGSWRLTYNGRLRDSFPLAASRFDYAHAAGLSGAGQVVGIVDSGFRLSHEVFDGRTVRLPDGGVREGRHGTSVASVLAADTSTMVGAAPGVELVLGTYDSPANLAAATRAATAAGAVVQNNSWGYAIDVGDQGYASLSRSSGAYLNALEDFARQGVVVFAASNDHARTRSTIMEALPAMRPELEGAWIAVVNAVPDFDDARVRSAELLSSGCLEAARWCLAADGAWTSADGTGDRDYDFATGTSYAAPQVSGAIALLAEAFPDLTPHDLRVRLLASADDSFFDPDGAVELAPGFIKGYDREFGHGFLDVRAALLPIGTPVLTTEAGATVAADGPLLVAGGAVGDAVVRSLAAERVLVTDVLGGDFTMPGDALVAERAPRPLMAGAMARLGGAETGMFDGLPGRHAEIRLAATDMRAEFLIPDENARADDFGVALTHRAAWAGGDLSVSASLRRDGSGALGLSAARSGGPLAAALGISAVGRAGDGFVEVGGEIGVVSGQDAGIADIGAARFASLGVTLGRNDAFTSGDRLTFGVTMPRAITSGAATMVLPVARSAGGIEHREMSVSLAPADREMRIALGYATPLGPGWSFGFEAAHAVNRGHVAGRSETGVFVGLSARF